MPGVNFSYTCGTGPGEFVPFNVAGLDDKLFSDTLFGHLKGAFTGADKERQGLLAKADVPSPPETARGPESSLFLPDPMPTLKEIERAVLEEALKRSQGNQTIAAQMIGMTRSALNKRLNKPG